jgi:23S rRNA (cytosine1962-C5)-methyltransferase
LPEDVARRVQAGHPWVFRDALGGRAVVEPTGSVVELLAYNRQSLGRGFVDQEHAIVIRMLSPRPAERVHPGAGAIAARFTRAVQLRWQLLGSERPTRMRLFSGDSEGLPGANVDRFGEFVVVQWLSSGALGVAGRALRRHRGGGEADGPLRAAPLRPLGGQAPPSRGPRPGRGGPLEIVVEEAGCRFGVDVTAPLGVGFYPDLRRGSRRGGGARRRIAGCSTSSRTPAPSRCARPRRAPRGGGGGQRGQGARTRPPQPRAQRHRAGRNEEE